MVDYLELFQLLELMVFITCFHLWLQPSIFFSAHKLWSHQEKKKKNPNLCEDKSMQT